MRGVLSPLLAVSFVSMWGVLASAGDVPRSSLLDCLGRDSLAQEALSEDATIAEAAIERLRAIGPRGRDVMLREHRELVEALEAASNDLQEVADPRAARFVSALDAVCGQRDSFASRLYWYTDLEQAKAAAQQEGKPILSLRLLGQLTDEYSCANSRFFRTALYANREVSSYLREHFVLHWDSVRPVPRVTIDFGDGRTLERTLTGNSIHYILDASGRPVDALPGLYGPQAFLRHVQIAAGEARNLDSLPESDRPAALAAYHSERKTSILRAWQVDLQTLNLLPASETTNVERSGAAVESAVKAATAGSGDAQDRAEVVDARRAAEIAIPKYLVEMPILAGVQPRPASVSELANATTDDVWRRIAELHRDEALLDAASRRIIERQNGKARRAMELALPKGEPERPLLRMVQNFQQSMAVDTVRNEYELHRRIHEWFAANPVDDLESLNRRVYAELFLTPDSDPWLGLVDPDVYTALENGGVRE